MSEELRRELELELAKTERLANALARARDEIASMKSAVEAVNRPPVQVATVVSTNPEEREAEVIIGGRTMYLSVAPQVNLLGLTPGQDVRVNDNMIVSGALRARRTGQVASVVQVVGVDRVLVKIDSTQHMVLLAGPLRHGGVRPGDSLLVDPRAGMALERVVRKDVEQLLQPETPDVTYSDIGGLDAEIEKVRDAVELPFKNPQLYRDYGLRAPKGILLYGPPGSGKTLIAKAVASSLAKESAPYFLSIKGPELLNKFVGEAERQIRAIFARARQLASQDVPVLIFFDEMEALFKTRGSGISSDVETMLVPQLLAEMDGLESLDNVIIIGASNREDMIDPAVLRPGRLDVRVRISRPNKAGARDIFSKYLTPSLPYSEALVDQYGSAEAACAAIIDALVNRIFTDDAKTAMFEVTLASGETRTIYASSVVSGAMIAAIVERAKKFAVKDTLRGKPGLTEAHLWAALEEEFAETRDLAASTTPQEWAQVTGIARKDVAYVKRSSLEEHDE